jgi:hypothetical protein
VSVDPTFEVIRFQVAPAGNDVAVIELEGRPADPQILGARIQLLLENPVERLELRPIVEPDGADDGILRATFAAPLELAADLATGYALSTGRGPLLELPVPDNVGDTVLEVRLARTVNALRGELSDARRRLGGIVGTVRGELAAEREGATSALAADRAAHAAVEQAATAERERLEAELADAHGELGEVREELARAQARISELEATLIVPRAPRVPRGPGPRPPRAPRRTGETEEHEPVVRRTHSSLGRSTARAAMLIALAVVLVIIVVVVLQVRVLN